MSRMAELRQEFEVDVDGQIIDVTPDTTCAEVIQQAGYDPHERSVVEIVPNEPPRQMKRNERMTHKPGARYEVQAPHSGGV
jgi:hypothetical protein